ncbi:MAG TPA: class I SAM-dependent methyltransferase [Terracidiphilus sp.]|nr:class I SAM-dependent methyltransferase [Terracidiphilus sp.]
MTGAANFDRLARAYRWMEALTFGSLLMRTRCTMLNEMKDCRRALVLGDGDGRFTARLLETSPSILIDAVDASAAMLAELRRNAGPHAERVHMHLADAREWQPMRTGYDLIVMHFFLDCLTSEEVHALAARLREACAPDVRWVVSEFAVPRGWFGAVLARPLVALLYRTFGLLTRLRVRRLPDHRSALVKADFKLAGETRLLHGLLVSELWRI